MTLFVGRKVFAVTATSVAPECMFSIAENITSKKRASLTCDHFKDPRLIYLRCGFLRCGSGRPSRELVWDRRKLFMCWFNIFSNLKYQNKNLRSEKCFPQSLRPQHAVGARAARGSSWYTSLRLLVPNVSFWQWIMTLSLGHDMSECVFVHFGDFSQKKWRVQLS